MPDPAHTAPLHSYDHVAVVIPALDEQESIGLVLDELPPVGLVLVVDNGSRDQTAQVAAECGATVLFEPRRGYGSACQLGIAHAMSWGAQVVVILDADHSDFPAELPLLVDPILKGEADMVLGERLSRWAPGALFAHQRYGNALATTLIARVTGHRYQDMGPFRAIRATSLQAMNLVDLNYGWNVEMQIRAIRLGLRVKEVAVGYRPRVGVSKISGTLKGTVKAGAKIIWSTWRYAR